MPLLAARKKRCAKADTRLSFCQWQKMRSRGPALIKYLAMIAAWVGDKDLACQQLAIIVPPPSPVTYGQLKLLPFWDPLRGDPRFEKTRRLVSAERKLAKIPR